MFTKKELRLLWPFYAQSLTFNLTKVIMPFYVLYFLSIGLNLFQIAILGSIRSLVALLSETPTGVIADLYGRKVSVILGYSLASLTLFATPLFHNFYLLALILALDALFETLVSGADRAWSIDLIEERDSGLLDKYFLRTRLFRNIGLIAMPIMAGLIVAYYDMRNLWVFFAVGSIIATSFLIFAPEAKHQNKIDPVRSRINQMGKFYTHLKDSLAYCAKSNALLLLFAGIAIFYFVDEITSLAWTPYLSSIGLRLPIIGYLFSAVAGIGIITPLLVELILKKKNKLVVLLSMMTLYAILMLSVGTTSSLIVIATIFVLFNSVEDIFLPIEDALTNLYVTSANRATILSIKSSIVAIASLIGGPIAGYLLGIISQKQSLVLSGI